MKNESFVPFNIVMNTWKFWHQAEILTCERKNYILNVQFLRPMVLKILCHCLLKYVFVQSLQDFSKEKSEWSLLHINVIFNMYIHKYKQ